MKPIKLMSSDGTTVVHHCGNCGSWIEPHINISNKFISIHAPEKFCHFCGCKIDWDDEVEGEVT